MSQLGQLDPFHHGSFVDAGPTSVFDLRHHQPRMTHPCSYSTFNCSTRSDTNLQSNPSTCFHTLRSHPGLDVAQPRSCTSQIPEETFTHTELDLDLHQTLMSDFRCRLATSVKFLPFQQNPDFAMTLVVHPTLHLYAFINVHKDDTLYNFNKAKEFTRQHALVSIIRQPLQKQSLHFQKEVPGIGNPQPLRFLLPLFHCERPHFATGLMQFICPSPRFVYPSSSRLGRYSFGLLPELQSSTSAFAPWSPEARFSSHSCARQYPPVPCNSCPDFPAGL